MYKTQMTRFYILALAIFSVFPSFAQEDLTDHGLWNSIDLQKKWKNGIAIDFEEEYRMRDDMSKTDKFMSTIDLSYKPYSFIKAGASYCLINYNHPGKKSTNYLEYWELRHRYSLYVQGSYDFYRFEISLKERYQSTYRVGVEATDTRANPKDLLRSKIELDYNVKGLPLTPYVACELQHSLNNPSGSNGLVEIRYAAGLEYEVLKGFSVNCGYLYDIDKSELVNVHVLTLGIGYSF